MPIFNEKLAALALLSSEEERRNDYATPAYLSSDFIGWIRDAFHQDPRQQKVNDTDVNSVFRSFIRGIGAGNSILNPYYIDRSTQDMLLVRETVPHNAEFIIPPKIAQEAEPWRNLVILGQTVIRTLFICQTQQDIQDLFDTLSALKDRNDITNINDIMHKKHPENITSLLQELSQLQQEQEQARLQHANKQAFQIRRDSSAQEKLLHRRPSVFGWMRRGSQESLNTTSSEISSLSSSSASSSANSSATSSPTLSRAASLPPIDLRQKPVGEKSLASDPSKALITAKAPRKKALPCPSSGGRSIISNLFVNQNGKLNKTNTLGPAQ